MLLSVSDKTLELKINTVSYDTEVWRLRFTSEPGAVATGPSESTGEIAAATILRRDELSRAQLLAPGCYPGLELFNAFGVLPVFTQPLPFAVLIRRRHLQAMCNAQAKPLFTRTPLRVSLQTFR